jgi:hypothetical protein
MAPAARPRTQLVGRGSRESACPPRTGLAVGKVRIAMSLLLVVGFSGILPAAGFRGSSVLGWGRGLPQNGHTAWDTTIDFCLERATESTFLRDPAASEFQRAPSTAPEEDRERLLEDPPSSLFEEEEDEKSWSVSRTVPPAYQTARAAHRAAWSDTKSRTSNSLPSGCNRGCIRALARRCHALRRPLHTLRVQSPYMQRFLPPAHPHSAQALPSQVRASADLAAPAARH